MKINSGYYRDMLLSQQLLPVMREVSDDLLIFQQDICTPRLTPTTRHCDFLSSQHPLSFLQICGRQIAWTLIRSITR